MGESPPRVKPRILGAAPRGARANIRKRRNFSGIYQKV